MQPNTRAFIRYSQSKLPFNFWRSTQGLSDHEKVLLAYLYTSPCSNRLGCFPHSLDNIVQDLDCTYDETDEDLYELKEKSFVSCDSSSNWFYLPHYLTYFPIRNPNQGKHIEALFYTVPSKCHFYLDLVHQLLLINHLQKTFRKYLKHLLYSLVQKRISEEEE